jgi:hypothetical protein
MGNGEVQCSRPVYFRFFFLPEMEHVPCRNLVDTHIRAHPQQIQLNRINCARSFGTLTSAAAQKKRMNHRLFDEVLADTL